MNSLFVCFFVSDFFIFIFFVSEPKSCSQKYFLLLKIQFKTVQIDQ